MNKVLTGLTVTASAFLLTGCASHSKETKNQTASSKVAVSKHSNASSARTQLLYDTTTDVDSLFTDSKHTALVPETKKTLLDQINQEVNKLTNSKSKTKLQKDMKKAYVLYPNLASSVATSKSISSDKFKSESISESIVALSSKTSSKAKGTRTSSETKKTSTNNKISYKPVSLQSFTSNIDKYTGKNIETSGHVVYIQKNPANEDVYFVVIVPKDSYSSTGYSLGTVSEVNIDTMQDTPIHDGDDITVSGTGLASTVKLNGHTLASDIVVDSVVIK